MKAICVITGILIIIVFLTTITANKIEDLIIKYKKKQDGKEKQI